MKSLIKTLLRENLYESIELINVGDNRVKLLCKNEQGQAVGYAIIDLEIDVENYLSSSYDDADIDYVDPDLGRHFPHGKAAKLKHLEVFHGFRKDKVNKFGAQLMNAVLKYCKENDIKTILLSATPIGPEPRISIEDLKRFYTQFGFDVIKIDSAHDMVRQVNEIKKEI